MIAVVPALLSLVAVASPVDEALDRMIASRGEAYLAARDDLLAQGPAALPVVDARLAAAPDAEARATLLAARAWLVAPDACARAYRVQGLDPQVYLRARKAVPLASRELARLPDEAKPVLVELWTKTRDAYPWAPASAYPKGADVDALRAAEREALDAGLLQAMGGSRLDVAPLLARALVDERAPSLRRAAAQALGLTHDARAVDPLVRALKGDADPSVRHAAIAGLGVHRSRAALDVLAELVVHGDDATRATAATALATLGSSWANADPALREGAIRALRAAPKSGAVDQALARLSR